MRESCVGSLFGMIFGHKYEARYSYGEPTITDLKRCFPNEAVRIINSTKPATYICDVCVRCGNTIRKEEKCEPTA